MKHLYFSLKKKNSMMRIFLLLFIISLFNCISVSSQNPKSLSDAKTTSIDFKSYIDANDYMTGIQTAYSLIDDESLTEEDFDAIALCFQEEKKYLECIGYVNSWKEKHPYKSYNIFDAIIGECYYLQEKFLDSEFYLAKYIKNEQSSEKAPNTYYLGIYAVSLYRNHKYTEAERYFSSFFNELANSMDIEIADICNVENANMYGHFFYEYAYNEFMLGQEKKGAILLEHSTKCGFENASKDLLKLRQNIAFATNYKYPKNITRKYDNLIQELNYYKDLPSNPHSFWYQVKEENIESQKLKKAFEKGKLASSLSEAVSKINKLKTITENGGLAEFNPYTVDELEKTLDRELCGSNTFLKEIRIYPEEMENAFTTPFGHIYITSGLLSCLHYDIDLLLAVCAHEVAHYLFDHSLVREWKATKREKRNEIWAGIAAGINTGAAYYGAANGVASNGGQDYWENVNKTNDALINGFREDAYLYKFKYDRKQELESDIIAYRFCEATGIGGYAMIMALQLLDGNGEYLTTDDTSDHPSKAFRIGLLKHLWAIDHPDLVNMDMNYK